jgi:hypothetical protein
LQIVNGIEDREAKTLGIIAIAHSLQQLKQPAQADKILSGLQIPTCSPTDDDDIKTQNS